MESKTSLFIGQNVGKLVEVTDLGSILESAHPVPVILPKHDGLVCTVNTSFDYME